MPTASRIGSNAGIGLTIGLTIGIGQYRKRNIG